MYSRTACLLAAAFALLLGHSTLAQTPAAITGKVSSAEEGLMEGVVISAKKDIVTVSVVSNAKGEFSFPADQARSWQLCADDQGERLRPAGSRRR